ncbi:MAG: CYTH domain-containing protein [Prochloraceae cyanobacterium]
MKYLVPEIEAAKIFNELRVIPSIDDNFQLALAKRMEHIDTYYDNSTLSLLNNGVSLRTRQKGNNCFLVTLKLPKQQSETPLQTSFCREEIEGVPDSKLMKKVHMELERNHLTNAKDDSIRLGQNGVEGVFLSWGLRPFFRLNTQRTVRSICDRNGLSIAELALDKVEIRVGDRVNIFYEIEVESKSDKTLAFQKLTSWLKQMYSLRESNKSKYQRGIDLLNTAELYKIV